MNDRNLKVPPRQTNAAGERTRELLLDAAERLIAVHGEGVPLRQIALAAGQLNNSAITYHFGTRRKLVEAVWDRRTRRVNAERAAMMADLVAAGKSDDLHALMEAHVLPMVQEIGRLKPSFWARFNEVALARMPLMFLDEFDQDLASYPDADVPMRTLSGLFHQMRTLAAGGREPAAGIQVALVVRFVVGTLAAWERDEENGGALACTLPELAESLVVLGERMLTEPLPIPAEASAPQE
jgi:AcrR family transcriptional regulator